MCRAGRLASVSSRAPLSPFTGSCPNEPLNGLTPRPSSPRTTPRSLPFSQAQGRVQSERPALLARPPMVRQRGREACRQAVHARREPPCIRLPVFYGEDGAILLRFTCHKGKQTFIREVKAGCCMVHSPPRDSHRYLTHLPRYAVLARTNSVSFTGSLLPSLRNKTAVRNLGCS